MIEDQRRCTHTGSCLYYNLPQTASSIGNVGTLELFSCLPAFGTLAPFPWFLFCFMESTDWHGWRITSMGWGADHEESAVCWRLSDWEDSGRILVSSIGDHDLLGWVTKSDCRCFFAKLYFLMGCLLSGLRKGKVNEMTLRTPLDLVFHVLSNRMAFLCDWGATWRPCKAAT